ncbi:hypothetical protein MVEN_01333800 [Mycena venus]|uniref:DUF6533 domain-containing protein n=1 Tax=Mycena venus TaxID=2733690 RepID=A0A8H6XXV9_9AGAR|nr:hypothetical protein MVEN_01333800 [Mycena venus]
MPTFLDSGLSASEIQVQLNFNAYISLASFCLLFHDFFLTIEREVSRYWGTRLTWVTFLFYFNRYGSIFGALPVIAEYFWTSSSPSKSKTYHQIAAIIAQIVVGTILVMRTYALYGQSRLVLTFMLSVAFGALAFGAWSLVSVKRMPTSLDDFYPFIGCAANLSTQMAHRFGYAWMGMLVFDGMILILTVWKAFQAAGIRLAAREATGQCQGGLVPTLVRDGTLYFLVMALANSMNIASFMLLGPYIRGVGTTMTNVLSSIMITRFMLNLRDPKLIASVAAYSTMESTSIHDMRITTVEPYYGTGVSWADEYDSRWLSYSNVEVPLKNLSPVYTLPGLRR